MQKISMPDGGPIYTETNLNNLLVEPWNTASALLFLLMSVYWFYVLKGRFTQFGFLSICLSLLTIGAIGGVFYHALRVSKWLMYMDWLPILLLCILASLYFTFLLLKSWPKAIGIASFALAAQFFLYQFVATHNVINLNYAIMGGFVLIPTLLLLYKNNFRELHLVAMALLAFMLALTFRIIDKYQFLSIGTHFLWHLFGAMSGHLMFLYIYRLKLLSLKGFIKVPIE